MLYLICSLSVVCYHSQLSTSKHCSIKLVVEIQQYLSCNLFYYLWKRQIFLHCFHRRHQFWAASLSRSSWSAWGIQGRLSCPVPSKTTGPIEIHEVKSSPKTVLHTVAMFPQPDDLFYLEDKKLLTEDGQSVEASITDVGFGVGIGGLGPLWRAVGSGMAVMLAGVWRRVEAGRRNGGWGPGRLRGSIWWT